MHYFRLRILILLVILFVPLHSESAKSRRAPRTPKNVILFIGDGMGYNQLAMTKELTDKNLFLTSLPVTGTVLTRSLDAIVTDSAAAASAMASGHKVNNHHLSISTKGRKHITILEAFRSRRKKTGLVTTSEIVDATPAAFIAHVRDRKHKDDIADVMSKSNIDLLLGGGRKYFLPKSAGGVREDGRNLLEKMKRNGYHYAASAADLPNIGPRNLKKNGKILGLFHTSYMNYEIDREERPKMKDEPPLSYMTEKAIEVLSASKSGFFLMVEGGRIDHSAHQLDAATMAQEVIEFDKAVRVAHRFAKKNRRTLVLVTADHETSGLATTESLNHDYLRKQKISSAYIYDQWKANDFDDEFIIKSVKEHFDYKLIKSDLKRLKSMKAKGKFHTATVLGSLIAKKAGLLSVSLDMILEGNTFGHTASPVPIFGFGPKSNTFSGYMDNTLIAKKISKAARVPLKSQ